MLKFWICFEDRTYKIVNLFYIDYKRKEWIVIPRFLACGTEIWNCRKKSHWGRLGALGEVVNSITLKDLLNITV